MGVFFLIIVGILNLLYVTEGSMMKGQHFNPNRHACKKNYLVLIVSSMNASDGQVK